MSQRKLTILYGSETGTAQEVSENIWRESKRYHCHGFVKPMDDYDVKSLIDEKLVLFVCSTTGCGEEPENMKTFWKFLLRKNLPTNSLSNLSFGVIGLGDSSYQKFNFVAKKLHKRILQLGGNSILSIALCDDQHDLGIGGTLSKWIIDFWDKINEIEPLSLGINPLPSTFKTTKWTVKKVQSNTPHIDIYGPEFFEESISNGYVQVLRNLRTTADDHFQDVRLISFDRCNLSWEVGDVAYIRPKNSQQNIEQLFKIFNEHNLDINAEDTVVLEDNEEMPAPVFLKKPLSMKTIASQFWDLSSRPKLRAFEVLAYNCDNELEKEKLQEFASFEGQEELLNYVNRPRRTILEVLQDFPHATSKLTFDLLFELFQPIKPRAFSIASSKHSNRLDILVAIVEYYTRLKSQRKGLCSNWLKDLKIGDRIRICIKKGTLKFPKVITTPIIMVGPGTGLAIFRAVLQDAEFSANTFKDKFVLFFGCRYSNKDFHCKDELKRMQNEGNLNLFCAFSRDNDQKVYVQDLILREKSLLKNLIFQRGGYVFVSGNSKNMPKSVRESFEEVLEDKNYVAEMIKCGRYQEETWS
ncbi:NADPH-dependent diflavin oxidoreductase 1 [Chironomus tepperi]|uniref:NADPH-dependent diflavin oxidoreductase 1 n=1 Tax=Chironomus tepperi TaxID=113505 RepID=UPI00391F7163